MKSGYSSLITISIDGCEMRLFTKTGLHLSDGYIRIVLGGRGPYVEFYRENINWDSFFIPDFEKRRIDSKKHYYIECRSVDSEYVKLYIQKKTVKYADYKIGLCYISPSCLYDASGTCAINL